MLPVVFSFSFACLQQLNEGWTFQRVIWSALKSDCGMFSVLIHLFFFFFKQGKPDLNTTLPIRQTASIFKQPVTKVTNHPSNKVRSDPQRVTEQPRQVRIHLFPLLLCNIWDKLKIKIFSAALQSQMSCPVLMVTYGNKL